MRNPLSSYRSTILLTGLISLILILAIWSLGPRVGMPRLAIILVAAVILVAWLLVVVILVVRRKIRTTRSFAGSAVTVQPASPEPQQALGDRLERTIQWLKKSKLAKAGRDPIYDLPWYLFIGMQGSGKSTVIAQSGFNFSYTEPKRALGKPSVGPTEGCDLWVANEAVFIDPAGKYFTQDRFMRDWRATLSQIKGHRKVKPIDGIVLVVDVDSLLALSQDSLREQAESTRACLDMTTQEFGMVLPIYLLFSKSDLLDGFKEFFCELGDGGNEPLGATFRREQYRNAHPAHEFRRELDAIYRGFLGRRGLILIDRPGQIQEKVFAFPVQLSLIRDRLSEFVEVLFQLDQFRERPLLRGFYFTSSVQAGRSRDLAADLMTTKCGLPKPAEAERPEGMRSFFVNSLFTKVIIPDRSLAGLSADVRRRRLLARMALVGFAGVILPLVLMVFIWGAYTDNSSLIRALEISREISARDGKTAGNLSILLDLKNRLENLECRGQSGDCRIRGRRFHWGLFAGEQALNEARSVYLENLRLLFTDQLFYGDTSLGHKYNGLKTQLAIMSAPASEQATTSGQKEFNPAQAYTLLKTFLMFSAETKADSAFLEEQTRDYWLHGVQERDQPAAMELLRFYLHQLGDHRNPAYRHARSLADDEVIERIRKLLLVVEPDLYYYGIIEEEGGRRINSVTLAGVLEGKGVQIFDAGSEVEGTFSKVGWDTFVKDKIAEMKKDYEEERSWVLGTSAIGPSQPRIDEKLQSYYFRDYENSWWNFLSRLSVGRFLNFQDASQKLAVLADAQQSPVLSLFKVVAANTWEDMDSEKIKEIAGLDDTPAGTDGGPATVAQDFQSIHNFVSTKENQESPLAQYLKALSRLQVVIRSYLDANQPAAQIGEIGREADAALQVTNGLLVSFDVNSRRAVEPLLKQPIQNVLSILDRATPIGAVQDGRKKSLTVAGIVKEKNKNLDAANVALLEAYSDTKFQAEKEIMRTQTRNGSFQFPKPVNPGPFKICVSKKGDEDFYCGDVRLGQDTDGKAFELKRPRSMLVFGGGKLDLTIRIQ